MSETLAAGTWHIDPVHTEVGFSVRHMMVSKVRGRFEKFDATLTVAEDPMRSSVRATLDPASLNTDQQQRDDHVRSADFFDVANHPEWAFTSTEIRAKGEELVLAGDLTVKGKTRPVELALEFNGSTRDPYGNDRAGFHAEGEISRKDFGVDIELPMESGGVVVGDRIKLDIDAEFIRQEE